MKNPILINLSVIFNKPTGIATYALNVAQHLQSIHPILLTANQQSNLQCYSIPNNMTPAEGSKGHLRRLLWTQWQLPNIYKQLQSNLIYSPIPEAPLYTKCRYAVMCHDLIPLRFPQQFSPLTNYFRYLVPQVLKQAEHIICNSESTAKDITNYYGIDAKKITPILLAYDTSHFYPQSPEKNANLELDKPYFLYLGRHDPYKNIARLITAFTKIKNNQDYYLYIAGSTDPRFTPQLQQQVLELNLTQQVKFLDYISYQELPQLLSNSLALVYPTLWEGFGLPVLEAMACGTAVITSNLASLPEVTGDAAILINPYNVLEITNAMTEIIENQKMRSHFQKLSLARAKLFSWAKTGEQTKTVLQQFM
ncbi:Glycosyltransferase [Hyella patelloides LEGE 07179]|uniref:Glycosyltransferase n=1 Tax=Hyella patelloides LEGE 07179 TaxID=945734 RepID=A0A563VMU5_9CYAN|nr:glycosyltransferase family 1 protein [Hyella patelloides]VEP12653.1 Glycosyltransferase [Hyella patelloides LEGE 07179]